MMENEEGKKGGHPVFLVAALVTIVAVIMAYMEKTDLVMQFSGRIGRSAGEFTFAVSLVILVSLKLFFLWCFRNPKLGDRILGRNQGLPPEETSGFKYSGGGFNPESAGHEKKLASRRKSARALRKQMAARQRELDAEAEQKAGRKEDQ